LRTTNDYGRLSGVRIRSLKGIVMTEVDGADVAPTPGTADHYMYFLDWAEKKGELPPSTVANWRNASSKVLEIEDNWRDVNVVDFDLEAHLSRFEVLKRTAYTTGSMSAYKSRTKTGIEVYRSWMTGASDWKRKSSGSSRASKIGDRSKKSASATPATAPVVETILPKGEIGGHVPPRTTLIEYPFPLRPGVRALIALPEDFTEMEAKRVAKFVESLAFAEQQAITTGASGDAGQ
jgi:hypothetical protein